MSARRWDQAGRFVLPGYFLMVLLFLILPMLIVVPMSVSETRYLKFPPAGFTLNWYRTFFATQGWIDATARSLLIAVSSALLSSVVGTLAALRLSRDSVMARVLGPAFLAPQVVPAIILALGTLLIFSRLGLYGSIVGMVIVHAVLALPFVTTTVATALRQTGDTLQMAARIMGAGPVQAFWHVTLPTIRPAVLSGAIFAFFISFDELVIALFVMGRNETLPMRIWADMRQDLTPVVAAVASLLIGATIVAVLISEFLQRRAATSLRS
jgi:ABC-type spermidine/putrescine transport system permease subunit II